MKINQKRQRPGPRAGFDPGAPAPNAPAGPPPGDYFPPPADPYGQFYQQGPLGQAPGKGPSTAKIMIFTGCGCLTLIGVAVAALFIWAMTLPDYGAIHGDKLTPEITEYLYSHDLLAADENVIYFYDNTLYLTNEDLCFFTDRKIVSYLEGERNDQVPWEDVEDIESGEAFLAFTITVKAEDHRFLKCEIKTDDNEDLFYKALLDTWEEKKAE
ncbi:MAG TPA: hypothetical protein VM658_11435 [bacterium]|nr:hypothetical protein [bacterium]